MGCGYGRSARAGRRRTDIARADQAYPPYTTLRHAFSPTAWQRELEYTFSFVETPDHLAEVDDVQRDMLSGSDDRLICCDVGYGRPDRRYSPCVQSGPVRHQVSDGADPLWSAHHPPSPTVTTGFPINSPLRRSFRRLDQATIGDRDGSRCGVAAPPAAAGCRSRPSAW